MGCRLGKVSYTRTWPWRFHGKIFGVQGHEAGAGCGYGDVEEALCSYQTGAVGGGGAGEVEAVAVHSNTDTFHFGFSCSGGGAHSGLGYFMPMGDS